MNVRFFNRQKGEKEIYYKQGWILELVENQ